jgi:hypothetical protein
VTAWHALIQMVVETSNRRATGAQLAAQFGPTMSVEETLETPFLLIGTIDQMAEQLVRNRERYGFTYLTVHDPYMEAFAPVIEHLK